MTEILKKFGVEGNALLFGNGHINTTYLVDNRYILQKINTNVFPCPSGVMDNAFLVSEYIKNKCENKGEPSERRTLDYMKTLDGEKMYTCESGVFRMYHFIDGAYTVDDKKTPDVLYNAGKAIGDFQKMLSDFDVSKLYTVIPDFHNTPKRLENLEKSISLDKANRVSGVSEEISFARSLAQTAELITTAISEGTVPLRVSHNDTKLNNVLFDDKTGEGICLIDLDTVMEGSYLYDFGDAMRFGASSCAEDCTDLEKIYFDLELFEAFTKGYLEIAKDVLTKREKELIFTSVILMTYECGTRFLTDYIDGDVYFKTAYKNHNLDRARNQYALVRDMLSKRPEAEAIVKKYL